MKNILYTIILSFLFSSVCLADFQAAQDAIEAGDYETVIKEFETTIKESDHPEILTIINAYADYAVTGDYETVFQSRFGKSEWIKPYLAERLKKLPTENIRNIQVFCPGFVADCLETIEEIGEESHDLFLESKGLKFNFIPCLNNYSDYIEAMIELIRKNV